jgi:hypothetical protein
MSLADLLRVRPRYRRQRGSASDRKCSTLQRLNHLKKLAAGSAPQMRQWCHVNLVHLDARVRGLMLEQVDADIAAGNLYLGSRLTDTGRRDYPELLREAVRSHDMAWLAAQLREVGRLALKEQRRKPKGGHTTVDLPVSAADTLAEGEFNRFYVRALCRIAIKDGVLDLIVCRAKAVMNPRPDSEAMIGQRINAQSLLDDLRANIGTNTARRLPSGPNSGLTVRLP